MWYVFLWLSICSLTGLCQRINNYYSSNYIKPFLYPRIDFNRIPLSNTGDFNKIRDVRSFGNKFSYLRNPFESYSNKLMYVNPVNPCVKHNTMVEAYAHNYLDGARRNDKRRSREFRINSPRSYGHFEQFPNYPTYWNPYAQFNSNPLPMSSKSEWKPVPEIGIFNNKKILHRYRDDGIADNLNSEDDSPVEIDLTVTTIDERDRGTSEKNDKFMMLPSDIIIKNIGPWVSKSNSEVQSKNIGSLSLIYNSDDNANFSEGIDLSGTLQEDLKDNCCKCSINRSTSSVIGNSTSECSVDLINFETSDYFNVTCKSTACNHELVDASEMPDNLFSSSQDPKPSHTSPSSEILKHPNELIIELDEDNDLNSSTKMAQENISDGECSEKSNDEISLDSGSDTNISASPEESQEPRNTIEKESYEACKKGAKDKSNQCLYKISNQKLAEHASYTGLNGKNKKLCYMKKGAMRNKNEQIMTNFYGDEPVTFLIEDYICECYHQSTSTTEASFLKGVMSFAKDHSKPVNYRKANLGNGRLEQDEHLPNVWEGLNNSIIEGTLNAQDGKEDVRTKRNIKFMFRRYPKRKKKREFVSNEDALDDSYKYKTTKRKGTYRGRFKASPAPKIHHRINNYNTKKLYRSTSLPQQRNKIPKLYVGRGIYKQPFHSLKAPINNKKREYVSFGGYTNGSCLDDYTSNKAESTLTTFVSHISTKESQTEQTTAEMTSEVVSTEEITITSEPTSTEIISYKTYNTMEPTTEYSVHVVPDTGNRHPAKMACEEEYQTECTCNIGSVVSDLNSIVARDSNMNILLRDLIFYNCSDYKPLNVTYNLASDLKPRLITKKQKELLVDEENGPKEITPDTFQDMLWRGIPNEGMDFYIFPSTSIQVPCFTHNDIQLSPNLADSTKYVWKHGNNKAITEGRVTEDVNHRGMLEIKDATVVDSDNYSCTVTYMNPDTGKTLESTFVHSVMVVQLPKLALHTVLHYNAPTKCEQETLEMFELYLPQQIEELICSADHLSTKVCTLEIYNPLCQKRDIKVLNSRSFWVAHSRWYRQLGDTSEDKEKSEMEMSLNYQLDVADIEDVIPSATNRTRCDPFCQLKILLKMMEVLRDSLIVSLSNSVSSTMGITFEPDLTTLNLKMLIACDGGLKLFQGFCIGSPVSAAYIQ